MHTGIQMKYVSKLTDARRTSREINLSYSIADFYDKITYISSHAKQEYLYEVYATEPDRAFWRELAKCNQEEFEKAEQMENVSRQEN